MSLLGLSVFLESPGRYTLEAQRLYFDRLK